MVYGLFPEAIWQGWRRQRHWLHWRLEGL